MKVCTDACILGAWVAQKIEKGEISPQRILDIGSSTGLLSLMLAQKSSAEITAVEINTEAYLQSKENIERSPWQERIHVLNKNIIEFNAQEKFDLIICNPPFYDNDLKSPSASRNEAMHSDGLSFSELAKAIKRNLSEAGIAAVLLPFHRVRDFSASLTNEGLFIEETLQIAHSPSHKFFRAIQLISLHHIASINKELCIKDNTDSYSEAFTDLLKEYYLKL